jgi:hypothetical protein
MSRLARQTGIHTSRAAAFWQQAAAAWAAADHPTLPASPAALARPAAGPAYLAPNACLLLRLKLHDTCTAARPGCLAACRCCFIICCPVSALHAWAAIAARSRPADFRAPDAGECASLESHALRGWEGGRLQRLWLPHNMEHCWWMSPDASEGVMRSSFAR